MQGAREGNARSRARGAPALPPGGKQSRVPSTGEAARRQGAPGTVAGSPAAPPFRKTAWRLPMKVDTCAPCKPGSALGRVSTRSSRGAPGAAAKNVRSTVARWRTEPDATQTSSSGWVAKRATMESRDETHRGVRTPCSLTDRHTCRGGERAVRGRARRVSYLWPHGKSAHGVGA